MIIDSHFHAVSMRDRKADIELDGVAGIEIGLEPGDFEERIAIVGNRPGIFMSSGSGPWNLGKDSIDSLIERQLADIEAFGADAIGEAGFDNHWHYGSEKEQMELFLRQAEIASEMDKLLVIHTREADSMLLESFRSSSFRCRAVMHCFASDIYTMEKALDKGIYISFAGNSTYRSNHGIRECARLVPLDRLLVETDSPYLSPEGMRGRPNRPQNTEIILDMISTLRSMPKEKLKEAVLANLKAAVGSEESVVKRDLSSLSV